MPRASDGTVTLVTGNPVVDGTVIDTDIHNATVADLASMIQDSLSRSGKGGMQAAMTFADGASATPSIAFTNETNTGLYRAASNDVRISMAGSDIFRLFKSTGNYFVDLFTAAFVKTIKLDWTDKSGGAAQIDNTTINKPAGKVLAAITGGLGTGMFRVDNSLVTANSIVLVVLQTNTDATCTSVGSVVPAAGSFMVKFNANPTGNITFGFTVFN